MLGGIGSTGATSGTGRGGENPQNPNKTFSYPILLTLGIDSPMKNISPLVLPNYRGLPNEDPNQFLFELKIICKIYDYELNNQNLKLFFSTLKDNARRWFMGFALDSINTWAKMEREFLKKYQEYCRVKDRKDKLFRIKQDDIEILEDYLDQFLFMQKRVGTNLDLDFVNIIFLRGLLESSLDVLNLMGRGNIFTLDLDEIIELCRNYSRKRTLNQKIKFHTEAGAVSELIEELANFKTNILVELN